MKPLVALTGALVVIASPAFGSTSMKFVAANQSIESQVCVVAAQQGVEAATATGSELGLSKSEVRNLVCNGRLLTSFSRKYQRLQAAQVSDKADDSGS
ncbi:hypothetical protein GCM10011369_10610 [Neiella marina]|uniref:DUF3718 domain-containing protein n=1 Tax=Neiella marina TaxID=508461 RepID=A0A8J2U3H2_9GAMM|nr:hypothetical protein [Neiella marina]GGA70750.1 hypothetical protein GCM10011369_10610 [Neiella marina]